MTFLLLICAVVLLLCVLLSRVSARFGVPSLLLFMVLGMLFGSDGILKIPFDDYGFAESVCSGALIFIMYSGGFGTNWKAARPVVRQGALLSVGGVIITGALTGLFCHFVLNFSLLEGLLVGAVIGSTDAASVFSILRSKKLNLPNGLAPMLELESGSNDPTAFTLTVILLSLMADPSAGSAVWLFIKQLAFGAAFGLLFGWVSAFILRRVRFDSDGIRTIFVVAAVLAAYALPTLVSGNGYLSVYISGIVFGNTRILGKAELVHFFDSISGLMQILLFFLLGLLAFPMQIPDVLLPALAIAAFLTFAARPAAVFAILTPFRHPVKEQLLVSWAGLRGAASIVFAIFTITSSAYTKSDIFHIVFCIALLSVAFQGTLLPYFAKKLGLVDDSSDVMKTFNDYQDDSEMSLMGFTMEAGHPWCGQTLSEICLPPNSLVVMIKRDGNTIIPNGAAHLCAGDRIILSCPFYRDGGDVPLREVEVTRGSGWEGRTLGEIDLPENTLVMLIRREGGTLIPRGETLVRRGDVLVLGGAVPIGKQVGV